MTAAWAKARTRSVTVTFTLSADPDNYLHITAALATSAMHNRLVRPESSKMTVIYVYVLLLIAIWPCVTALRGHTPADYKFADALWTKAASPEMTSYGLPVSELLAKPTSVDHFGSVRSLNFCGTDLFVLAIWLASKALPAH